MKATTTFRPSASSPSSVAGPSAMPRAVILGNVKFQEEQDRMLPYESLDHTPAHGCARPSRITDPKREFSMS